jgi:Helix-turn-helix domain
MRGRKPHSLTIAPADLQALQQIARSQTLPFFQVQRARIVLEMAHGGRTRSVAIEARCDETTVRRTCHRYESLGAPGLLAPPQRPGRPAAISPPPAGADRPTGLPGTDRRRVAHHPLDQ